MVPGSNVFLRAPAKTHMGKIWKNNETMYLKNPLVTIPILYSNHSNPKITQANSDTNMISLCDFPLLQCV